MTIKDYLPIRGELLFVGVLLLFFITDTLNVIVFKGGYEIGVPTTEYTKISAYSKLLFLLGYFMFYSIHDFRLVLKIFFIGLFFILFPLSLYGFNDLNFVFLWGLNLVRFLFPVFLFDLLLKIKPRKNGLLFKIYLTLITFQIIVVFISAVFNIKLFLTYGEARFGYSGFLLAQNEATFYYVIATVFVFKHWENTKNRSSLMLLMLVLLATLLLGTKAIFLFLGSFVIFFGWYYNLYTKILFWISGLIVLAIVIALFYNTGVIEYYINLAEDKGWLYMLTSRRNILIEQQLPIVFDNWRWYNYLFGGVNPTISFVEMDMIDMFLFGGVVGSFMYYMLLFKTIYAFSKSNYLGWFLVSQYFLIGGLAGHVFASGINAIYLALTSYYLQNATKAKLL